MKIDPHLTLIKRLEAADGGRPGHSRQSPQQTRDGVVLLVSQENRRACQLIPTSLVEAKELLERVQRNLKAAEKETLAEVHHVEAQCLVRLR